MATMTKISDYLSNKSIDPRRVVVASRDLERRQDDDRELVAKKKAMKDGKLEKDEVLLKKKPRSGRPVTMPTMTKALAGRPLSGPTKTRIVRAVNAVLAQKGKGEASFSDLF